MSKRHVGARADMAIHHIVGGPFLKGTWEQASLGYQRILKRPPHLITIVREPVQHYLSCFYFFWLPDYGLDLPAFLSSSKYNYSDPLSAEVRE